MTQTVLLGQTLSLIDIVQNPSPNVAVLANLSERGGEVSFTRTYPNGCVGGYNVKVTFSKSLNMLQPGETFQITLNCEDCSSSCNYKWKFVSVFAASNIRKIDQYPGYAYNDNLEIVGSSNGSSGVNYWDPGMQSNVITLRYDPKQEVPLTAFVINVAGDHEIFYVFRKESNQEPAIGNLVEGIWSGWGTMTLLSTATGYNGTYSDTYVKSSPGEIRLLRKASGTWMGTWEEPSIGRKGILYDISISADGKRISGKYDTTQDGGKGNWQKGRSFKWTYKSPVVKK
jgi:hypothetical protein